MKSQKKETLDKEPLRQIVESMRPVTSGDLIPLLQKIQNIYGYLPLTILSELSKITTIPPSQIYGVATFYQQFYLEPHGRYTIKLCRGTACHVKGGSDIIRTLENELNVSPGKTTEDMRFTFETVACLGTCFLAPVMMVDNDYYGHLTQDKAKKILKKYK